MGLKDSDHKSVTYVTLKAKTSESDATPYFGRQEKTASGWEVVGKYNAIDGHFRGIEYSSYEYEGATKWKCKMKFVDPDGTVTQLESNFNNLLYSLLNSMRGQDLDFVEFQVWLGKAKIENGKEGKRYPSAKVINNKLDLGWQVDYKELPRPNKVKVGNTVVMDDSEVVEYWKEVINKEIKPNIKDTPPDPEIKTPDPVTEQKETQYDPYANASQPNDDLPF